MPELKKPEDKEDKNTSAFKNHSDDKVNTSNQHKESYQKDTKMNRTIIALSSSIIAIFIGVIIAFIFKRRKEDEEV